VLSGFLITGILLRERDRVASGTMPAGTALRTFYVRRFLRLFPAYYLLLAVLGVTALVPGFLQDWPWYVTYLQNWLIAVRREFPGGIGHLWSLAVEEQFYLFWPLVILLASQRAIPRLLIAFAAAAVLFRVVIQLFGEMNTMAPTIACLDSLAIGGMLAWHRHRFPGNVEPRQRALRVALWVGGSSMLATFVLSVVLDRGWRLLNVTEAFGAALVSVWLVNAASSRADTMPNRVLSWAPIAYLGKISYGMYLYHHVLIYAFRNHSGMDDATDWIGEREGSVFFLLVLVATIAAATLSWYAVERPINGLKRRFPYV
jgi:peptidoglycan/LPS O-acetylase OafA/YrhL